jgi:CPA2 family monovalent cation:H+ antiporter-2
VPPTAAGRRLAEVLGQVAGEGDAALRVVRLRSRLGTPVAAHEAFTLEGGETLVLSGKAEALSRAEQALAR